MDAKLDDKMVQCGTVAKIKGEKMVVGAKQIRKGLSAGRFSQVYLAENADPAITEPIAALCQQNNVKFVWVKSMIDLGRACGIEVGAAAAAEVA